MTKRVLAYVSTRQCRVMAYALTSHITMKEHIMSAYDRWLEKPYQDAEREQQAFEVEEEAFMNSAEFMPALIAWLTEELTHLGRMPINSEECDCALSQDFINTIVDEFVESHTYESIIEERLDMKRVEVGMADDFDVSDRYDSEYDR